MRSVVVGIGIVCWAGCTEPVIEPPALAYRATFAWTSETTPEATSVLIDDVPLASAEPFEIDEVYPSYEDALADFETRHVTITTTGGEVTGEIGLGECWRPLRSCTREDGTAVPDCPAPIVLEDVRFGLHRPAPGGLVFATVGARCRDATGYQLEWTAR